MKIIIIIYIVSILISLWGAKKEKDSTVFWVSFIPIFGTFSALISLYLYLPLSFLGKWKNKIDNWIER